MPAPRYELPGGTLYQGDCLEVLQAMPDNSVDAVVTDPPYAMVKRTYGCLSEDDWRELMDAVTGHVRRVLKPKGSAVFILQPNYAIKNGGYSVRLWLWEWLLHWSREWNWIQGAYWWNYTALPNGLVTRHRFMRGSLKILVWLGASDCWQDQQSVLWAESVSNAQVRMENRDYRDKHPSGHTINRHVASSAAVKRGGVTPFNVLPVSNTNSVTSGGAWGHPASTPQVLMAWWLRFICPPDATVLDPFMGSGTLAMAAIAEGRKWIGIEKESEYVELARRRIEGAADQSPGAGKLIKRVKKGSENEQHSYWKRDE